MRPPLYGNANDSGKAPGIRLRLARDGEIAGLFHETVLEFN